MGAYIGENMYYFGNANYLINTIKFALEIGKRAYFCFTIIIHFAIRKKLSLCYGSKASEFDKNLFI